MSQHPIPNRVEADAGFDHGMHVGTPRRVDGFRPFVIVPEGAEVQPLEPEPASPARLKASRTLHRIADFLAYCTRHGDESSACFYAIGKQFAAVLDYHYGTKDTDPEFRARYGEHVATFVPLRTVAWEAWRSRSGTHMDQEAFVEFLEANACDVVKPDPAGVVAAALDFKAHTVSRFTSAKRMASGAVQFRYEEDIDTRKQEGVATFPEELTLSVAPFEGCDPVQVLVRLRFRCHGGKLVLWFDLHRPDLVEREALAKFEAAVRGVFGDRLYAGA